MYLKIMKKKLFPNKLLKNEINFIFKFKILIKKHLEIIQQLTLHC